MSCKDNVYWKVQSLAADEVVRIKNQLKKSDNENERDNVSSNNGD